MLVTSDDNASYYPQMDGNGNITQYLDNIGNTVSSIEYDPFGKVHARSGKQMDIGFSSKFFDNEIQLSYYGFRYLDSESGRWINRDKIGENSGRALYDFVSNRSTNSIDYLGLIDTFDMPSDEFWEKIILPIIKKYNNMEMRKDTYSKGCIGITCLALGRMSFENPPLDNCYNSLEGAKKRRKQLEKTCPKKNNPFTPNGKNTLLYAINGYESYKPYLDKLKKPKSNDGKVKVRAYWRQRPKNDNTSPFDYAVLIEVEIGNQVYKLKGRWLHADTGGRIGNWRVFSSSIDTFKIDEESISEHYNFTVYCVACVCSFKNKSKSKKGNKKAPRNVIIKIDKNGKVTYDKVYK